MDGALGQLGKGMDVKEPMFNAPANNPLVSVASLSPTGMNNMMGSPLANAGANMMPYLGMQEAFAPKDQGTSSTSTYRTGGLVSFAEGGMAPQEGMDPEAAVQGALSSGGGDMQAQVEEIFMRNKENPEQIAQELIQLVMEEIQKNVSPEELAQLQTPEGQEQLMASIQEAMGGMGGAQGGLPQPQGGQPQMMAEGGLAQMAQEQPMEPEGEGGGELMEVAQMVQDMNPEMQLAHVNVQELEALAQQGEVMTAQMMAEEAGDEEILGAVQELAMAGQQEDTELVFLSQEQYQFLVENVREPSKNPMTGLPQFFFKKIFSGISSAVKSVVNVVKDVAKSPIFQAIAPIALNYFLPGIGTAMTGALGLSASWAPSLMGAVMGGAMGGISGKGIKGVLGGAAIGGITSGIADYLATGNNPLSGMFSGQEGGIANNSLTAAGTGSTNLTGTGSGLGVDKSTIATQFGKLDPSLPLPGEQFGQLNPTSTGSVGLKAPTNVPIGGAPKPSGFSGMWESAKNMAGKLIPDSTLGKVALGGTALSLLSGMGGGGDQGGGGGAPQPNLPQGFNERLPQYNYNRNPISGFGGRNLNTYGQGTQTYDPYSYGNKLGIRDASQVGEQRFFNPTFTNSQNTEIDPRTGLPKQPTQQARRGGLMHYAMGGYADGGQAQGYLKGAGDGVSDDIPATIGGQQPARLSGGEFVIPARIVSELGNGSSDAGALRLHQMMERVNSKRTNTKDFAKDTKAYNLLPA